MSLKSKRPECLGEQTGRKAHSNGNRTHTNNSPQSTAAQRRKPSPRYVLQSFIDFLSDNLDSFDQYPPSTQFHLAELAFEVGKKRRRHSKYEGFSTIGYQELGKRFGRHFKAINANLDFFDVTSDWSKKEKRTRGVRLSATLAVLKAAFLECDPVLSELVNETGKQLRTLPRNGIETEVNRTNRKNTYIKAVIPINHRALNRLIKQLMSASAALDADASYLIESARTIRHYAHTKAAGKMLIQRYSLAKSGRLYAKGVNLQNAPNIVTDAALSGCWEYDFDNCHYAIFRQLAARVGIQCTAISQYLTHKREVRLAIAEDVGLAPKQVKVCLLALMYGARETAWHKAAIPSIAGDSAPDLFRHPFFSKFAQEIKSARREIISRWPNTSQRSLINAMGRPISRKEDDRFVMAHLQQGIEAKMLHLAIDHYGDKIVLLKHDGFSTTDRIDTSPLVSMIRQEVGISIALSARQHRISMRKSAPLTPPTHPHGQGRKNTGQVLTCKSRHVKYVSPVNSRVKRIEGTRYEFF